MVGPYQVEYAPIFPKRYLNFIYYFDSLIPNMQFQGKTNEYLSLVDISSENCHLLKSALESSLSILWNLEAGTELIIDGVSYSLEANEVIFLTEFHKVETLKVKPMRMVRFNRSFYCILDHDSEVSCKGLLFYGASTVPRIALPEAELEKFEIFWKMFNLEMQSRDKLQIEMLQMMLKRFIILCTRLIKEQNHQIQLEHHTIDLIREFN
ncbi:MAG: hypothetical protein AAGD05_03745, partial [Bacteroidota bacterium]